MNLPRYFLVEGFPVKFVETEDGGMNVLKYNWQTQAFDYGVEFLSVVYGRDSVRELSEKEFEEYLDKIKRDGWPPE